MTVSTDTLGEIGEFAANWRASSALRSRQGTAINSKPEMRQLSPEVTTAGDVLEDDAVNLVGPFPFIESEVGVDSDDDVVAYDGEQAVNESDISAFGMENMHIRETIRGWDEQASPTISPRRTIAERRGVVISEMNLSDKAESSIPSKQMTHNKSMSAVPVIEYSLVMPALSPSGRTKLFTKYDEYVAKIPLMQRAGPLQRPPKPVATQAKCSITEEVQGR
jgi:hypothetical protein